MVEAPHAFQPQTVTHCRCPGRDVSCIRWTLRKLQGSDRNAVSKRFELSHASLQGPVNFKLQINAKESSAGKGGASFRAANGQGTIQLKCEAPQDFVASVPLTFWLLAGGGRGSRIAL